MGTSSKVNIKAAVDTKDCYILNQSFSKLPKGGTVGVWGSVQAYLLKMATFWNEAGLIFDVWCGKLLQKVLNIIVTYFLW